jgi:DNA-directed RNA polymerase
VRLDASCSGLQHLALLSRDTDLARDVNLWGDTQDAQARRELAWLEIAQPDFYKRIASASGASREQVKAVVVPMLYTAGESRCAEALAAERTRGRSSRASANDKILAARIREAARQLAPSAFAVLDWFTSVAKVHNDVAAEPREACPQPIYWATPSGFEAVQDYRLTNRDGRRARRRAVFRIGDRTIKLVRRELLPALDTAQQQISLPANLVHSLDAALLVETVAGADVSSWAVAHDAFGVPAGKVAPLQDSLVEGLRSMYTPDRLGEWALHWRSQNVAVPEPPGVRGPLPKEMLGGLRTIA